MLNKIGKVLRYVDDAAYKWWSKNLLLSYCIVVSTVLLFNNIHRNTVDTQATFISANGTTQTGWQIGGTAGATVNGTTGNLSYTGASGKGFSFTGNTSSTISTSAGPLTISNSGTGNTVVDNVGSGNTNIDNSGGTGNLNLGLTTANTINLGNNTNEPGIQIGDSTSSANQGILLGPAAGTTSFNAISLNSGTGFTRFLVGSTGSIFLQVGSTFQPKISATLACGTGGTQTVAANSFIIPVTTGTLSSNCIVDFTTNGATGLFYINTTGVTLGATFGLQFKNGTSSSAVFVSTSVVAGTLATVITSGLNTTPAVNF